MTSNLVQSIFMWHSLIYATLNEIWVKIYLNFTQSYYVISSSIKYFYGTVCHFFELHSLLSYMENSILSDRCFILNISFHVQRQKPNHTDLEYIFFVFCNSEFTAIEFNVSKSLYLLSLSHICSSQQRLSLMNVSW